MRHSPCSSQGEPNLCLLQWWGWRAMFNFANPKAARRWEVVHEKNTKPPNAKESAASAAEELATRVSTRKQAEAAAPPRVEVGGAGSGSPESGRAVPFAFHQYQLGHECDQASRWVCPHEPQTH